MMAYSSREHRFVLFGGWDGVKGLNSTWVYDPVNRTWSALHPAISPLGRGDGMFVYDERADNFILFGGWHEKANGTYIRLNDTWLFSLPNTSWMMGHPAVSPAARSDSEVAYDPRVGTVLLIGGFDGSAYLGDIWSYTPSNDTWSLRPAAVEPSPRADGRLVYIDDQDRFILFGGNDYSGPNSTFHHLADTWSYTWNSNVWRLVASSEGPSARDYPLFAYDSVSKVALLTGGYGNGTILNDLWALDIANDVWVDFSPSVSPPPRFAAAGGFDRMNQVLVLFSGLANTGLLADTWHYAYQPPPGTPSLLSPIVVVGVGSLIVGVAVAIAFILSRKHRPRRMT